MMIRTHNRELIAHLSSERKAFDCIRWIDFIYEKQLIRKNYCQQWCENIVDMYTTTSLQLRKNLKAMKKGYPVIDTNIVNVYSKLPIMFIEFNEEKTITPLVQTIPTEGTHLIVFAHGLQGSSSDLNLFRNVLRINFRSHKFLMSSSNETNSHSDILLMGEILAKEIQDYIEKNFDKEGPSRISFIGHSLGGVIIRAALPHLRMYTKKMFLYMSLCSPHLGVGYNDSSLFNTGLWVMKTFNSSTAVTQLSLHDSQNPFDTVLYKMSLFEGLNWFENVVFVSCISDRFSPFESSRVEINSKQSTGTEYVSNKLWEGASSNGNEYNEE